MNEKNNLIIDLKVSIQRALVSEITENMFAVTCGFKGKTIVVRAYYSSGPDESDVENLQNITTEVISDFPETFMIEEEALPLGEDEPEMLEFWAFKRARTAMLP